MSRKEDALKLYYEKHLIYNKEFHGMPYEFLYADEVAVFRKSLGFKIFNVRYKIELFVEYIAETLFN